MRAQVEKAQQDLVQAKAENQVLKAKAEFSNDVPKPPETVKSGGVLDRDIL